MKLNFFKKKNQIRFYYLFILPNMFFKFDLESNSRYKYKMKYNRLTLFDRVNIQSKFEESNLIKFNNTGFFNFKFSKKYYFNEKNLTSVELQCTKEETDKFYNIKLNKELSYFNIAKNLLINFPLCKGFTKELNKIISEENNFISINYKNEDLAINNNTKYFEGYINNLMQNFTFFETDAKNYNKKKIYENNTIFLGYIKNEIEQIHENDLNFPYSNNGYLIKINMEEDYHTFLYYDIMNIIVKNLMDRENLKLMESNFLIYFKKFVLLISLDISFEFANPGFIRDRFKYIQFDFYKFVRFFNIFKIVQKYKNYKYNL